MRKNSIKKIFNLALLIVFTSVFTSANSAFAETPVTVEKAGVALPAPKQIVSWGMKRIGAENLSNYNKGNGVRVAILDTGIDLDHPDLRVAGNVSFVAGAATGDDDNGHGTLVAGIIAARDNEIGAIGIAPEVELYAVKVLDSHGKGTPRAIEKGINWAIENGMQVINMSFGTTESLPESLRKALKKAYKAGIVIVAAAGNEGTADDAENNIWAPARYTPVIAVGATDKSDHRCPASSTGEALELVAPGENIYSTFIGGGYAYLSRTSAAAPHVTAVAALLIAKGVVSNDKVRQTLCDTADDLGTPGKDSQFGYGLIDIVKALRASSTSVAN
jgi:subtilisin family serine protease